MAVRIFKILLTIVIAGYLALVLWLTYHQRSYIYHNRKNDTVLSKTILPNAEPLKLATGENLVLDGWTLHPRDTAAPVFIYFYGNGGLMDGHSAKLKELTQGGAGLVAYNYRGYGKSEGAPSEAALIADGLLIFDDTRRLYPKNPIVIFGESLGSGVGLQVAAQRQSNAVVLDSPFYSMLDLVSDMFYFVPVRLVLFDRYRSDLAVANIHAPLLILHGEKDTLIPIGQAEHLYAQAVAPKEFKPYENVGHLGPFSAGAIKDVRAFLKNYANLDM